MEKIIELKNVGKSYDGKTKVIEDINLSIEKGEFVTLLGPSGCGKTTILRMIAGFESVTSGDIFLDGEKINDLPANKRPINTVFQNYALFPFLNIYDNIAFGLKLKKLPKDVIDKKVKDALEMVDLEGFEKRRVQTLSGGQQQRIAIARAIVNEPEILLLDEPLSALDYQMRKDMQLELMEMHKELGITFIFVTHDQEEALTMSDKVVVISDGKIQQIGTPKEIYDEPANSFVADFIGESNIYNGRMTGHLKVSFCDCEFECLDDYPLGMRIEAVVRPEDVDICKAEDGDITGEVLSVLFKGTFYEIIIQSGKNEIVAKSTDPVEVGANVGIKIEPDGIHVMPYDATKNHFKGVIESDGSIRFADNSLNVDLKKIFGENVPENPEGVHVSAFFDPRYGDLTDEAETCDITGNIISIIYKGDHYSYGVRSESGTDYYIDDDYLWNTGDYVGLIIPEDRLEFEITREEE
ncbi:MAG: ABC transporter ATP-binding protein [Eubacterium sp.]|nr:ABC transporter ATP-binding protein [Eubacterium sp.]